MKKILSILLLSLLISCSSEDPKSSFVPEMTEAQAYTIIRLKEYPTPPDKRGLEVVIFSEQATSLNKRAHTAMKAALDILNEKGLYEVMIFMNAYSDMNQYDLIAEVKYTPYKKNTWGTDEPYVWSVRASDYRLVDGKMTNHGMKKVLNQ